MSDCPRIKIICSFCYMSIVTMLSTPCFAKLVSEYHQSLFDDGARSIFRDEEVDASDYTKRALKSYVYIEERLELWEHKLKKITFDEHTENVLFFSPLVTGQVKFRYFDLDFKFDYRGKRGKVEYVYNF